MKKKFADIINEGRLNGDSIEVINAKLEEAGATFHLSHNGTVPGWTEQEMAEGFNPGEPAEDVKHLHDCMRFSPDKAGTEETVWTPEGQYRITYDEDGHPVKAVRLGS